MTASADVLEPLAQTLPSLENLRIDLHQHPELSSHETRTSAKLAELLGGFGFAVQQIGGGVVGVLANGDGPCVMLRSETDALPVTEATGLEWSSTVTATDPEGNPVGVAHACGHDVHMASLIGAAELLAKARDTWSGTLIALFQPAEETAAGAQAMLDAGLVQAIPAPDVALAQHVLGLEAGTVSVAAGPVLSIADSIKITVHGVGSHGSMPQLGDDPVVAASAIVQRLQGIVSRELAPGTRAVVTVGAFEAGTKSNIIPDSATLLVNTRAYTDADRTQILTAIERIVNAECQASNCPRPAQFEYYDQFPATLNDAEATATVTAALRAQLGADRVRVLEPLSASDDFSKIPDAFGAPYVYWGLGGYPAGTAAPGNHSPLFAPVQEPTLSTGTAALVAAAMAYLAPEPRS